MNNSSQYTPSRDNYSLHHIAILLSILVDTTNLWFVKKEGETGPTMQLFAGFTDDKRVVKPVLRKIYVPRNYAN